MELLILGLDGISTNMLERFDPDAPFLENLLNEGVSGDLWSVDPPDTFPAWTSFATGLDPSRHGVSNMVIQGSDYHQAPATPNTSEPAIYDFLPDSTFINLQASHGRTPAAECTTLVAGKLAPNKETAVPESLQCLPEFDTYQVFKHDEFVGGGKRDRPEDYVDHLSEILQSKHDFASAAFDKTDPNVGFVLFSALDWLSHFLTYAGNDDQACGWFTRLVEEVDKYCSNLASNAENVLILSDHGFEEKHYTVHINDLLADQEYLAEPAADGIYSLIDLVYSITKRSEIAQSSAKWFYDRLTAMYGDASDNISEAISVDVDHAESRAWDLRNGCIFLNDQRFVSPTVDDPDRLADELIEALRDVRLPTGDPAFRSVLRAEDVYSSPSGMVPNVIARPAQGVNIATTRCSEAGHISTTSDFDHRYEGIVGGIGPLFDTGEIEGMQLIDVLPTILHALGHKVPDSLDGEVASKLLSTDRAVEATTDVPEPRTKSVDSSDDVVEERLSDLGYI